MTNLNLTHDAFLIEIAKFLNYEPDSSNFTFYEAALELHNDSNKAFEIAKLITLQHIEDYDNGEEAIDIIKTLN